MDSFYCVGCRALLPQSRLGRLIDAAHLNGAPAGFCRSCLPKQLPELAGEGDGDDDERDGALSA